MFKKTVSYTDYNDEKQTRTLYFNLTRSEVIEMETESDVSFSDELKKIISEKNGKDIMRVFKMLILKSYGVKTEDGQGFRKNPELVEEFEQSAAYDALFMELCTNADSASEFISRVMPLDEEQRKKIKDEASRYQLPEG